MTASALIDLAVLSLTAPKDAARRLIAFDLDRDTLVLAAALVVVLNALSFGIAQALVPGGMLILSPVGFGLLLILSMATTILALTWAGRWLGGAARTRDMAVLVIWLQGLRVLVQVATIVLLFVSPALVQLTSIAATVAAAWIMVNFVDHVQGFGSLGKAFLSVVLGLLLLGVVTTAVFSMLGLTSQGMSGYV